MRKCTISLIVFLSCILSVEALAQAYPTEPIKLVIGFPPGTGVDAGARVIGDELEKRLGQPVILEFKPGANGSIAAKYVSNAEPDGYTLYYGQWVSFHPVFMGKSGVDIGAELAPVSRTATGPFVLASSAKIEPKTFAEIVKYSKANPTALKNGTPATSTNMLFDLLDAKVGIKTLNVPYKGSAPAVMALVGGQVDLVWSTATAFTSSYKAGTVRLLMVAAKERSPTLPNVLSATEVGLPDFIFAVNHGIWGQKAMSKAVTDKLSKAVAEVLAMPAVVAKFRDILGYEAVSSSPDGLFQVYKDEIAAWSEAARVSNFQPPQ